jgi:lysyl-tRNA synthetase class 2
MDLELSDLQEQRRHKADQLRELGIDPYAPRAARTHTTVEAIAHFTQFEAAHDPGSEDELEFTLAGRVVSRRDMGKTVFAHIRDGHGQIQLYLRVNDLGEEAFERFNRLVDLGDFIQATGRLFRTRTGEISLRVRELTVLTKALNAPPEKWKGLQDVEIRYRQRYVDLIANAEVRRVFEMRSRMISAIREFLDSQGFIEVETPTLQPLYGGAAARPFVTHHNALDQTFYLRIADELYLKRLIAGGYERVYEICKDFRNEGMDRNHQPEFTMLEWYEAYSDYRTVMDRAEALLGHVARRVHGSERFSSGGHEIDLSPPWRRRTLREAIKEGSGIDYVEHADAESLTRVARAAGADIPSGMVWPRIVDELLKQFVRPFIVEPTILYDYPVELSPLAKRKPGDPTHAERFQIYIAGHELGNAFTELNDPMDQLSRFLDQARDRAAGDEDAMPIDLDYVNALMYGMPPTGGIGIGIDRLAMFMTDQPNIRDVVLFPAMRKLPVSGLASLTIENDDDEVTAADGIAAEDQ